MKDTFRHIFKACLLTAIVLFLVLLIVVAVLVFGWPWWAAGFLLLLLTGTVVGGYFLYKLWQRRREENFVQEICEQDMARIRNASAKDRGELRELHERWKKAINRLRGSHLKKLGHPLYVLPWYMVIGESGSGKTTSLNSARIASPFTGTDQARGIAGTRQCDWYFFEQAILIDTAGRYTIPVNGDQDQREWQKFLSLLMRYRRREPLNGLIVTVAADRLLAADNEALQGDGQAIRQRIDELMRAIGIRVPVYVLVTKCDLISGINRFCEKLPEQSLKQPMGIINQNLTVMVEEFVNEAVTTIDERLRNLRLQLLHTPEAPEIDTALLLFPEEFAKIRSGLSAFMARAFRDNPYQETPALRGLFFSSGRQEGNPVSHFLSTLEHGQAATPLPGTSRGLFLHDFFASVLPRDRSLLTPTGRALKWRSLTNHLGLTSWVILGIAFCGLLSFSFIRNLGAIQEISHDFSSPAMIAELGLQPLADGQKFRDQILLVEQKNRNWWALRLGLTESLRVERVLKDNYCRQFRETVLTPLESRLIAEQGALSATGDEELYARHVLHEIRRINLIKSRLNGADLPALQNLPQPPAGLSTDSFGTTLPSETENPFLSLYHHYLVWQSEPSMLAQEQAELQRRLSHLIDRTEADLGWMITWVNYQNGLTPVTLQDFWGGKPLAAEEHKVLPAFTQKGKAVLEDLLRELTDALPEAERIAPQRVALMSRYQQEAFSSWQHFAHEFSAGRRLLKSSSEWQSRAVGMADETNAYFALLDLMSQELGAFGTVDAAPPWMAQLSRYQTLKSQSLIQSGGTLARAASGGGTVVATLRRNVGRELAASQLESHLAEGKTLQRYREALTSVTRTVGSRNLTFELTSQTFLKDQGATDNAFHAAEVAVSSLASSLRGISDDTTVTNLLYGPLDFLWEYARKDSACHLQNLWNEQVLSKTAGLSAAQVMPELADQNSPLWRFIQGPAAPFLRGGHAGYSLREALGAPLPIESHLLSFLRRSQNTQTALRARSRVQNFNVAIQGLPTNANSNAEIKPHATRLELQCGPNRQQLLNNNYPVSQTFTWSSDTCSDTLLQIEIGDLVLTRHYSGADGFPNFLRQMQSGSLTFNPSQFPAEKRELARMGVTSITVNYRFTGNGPILKQSEPLTGSVPRRIASCWEL